jgi:orotate phosphoribosyltransferase
VVSTLRHARVRVGHCLTLVDRGQGSFQTLARQGCELHSVFTAKDLFEFYKRAGKITPHLNDRIQKYLHQQRLAA